MVSDELDLVANGCVVAMLRTCEVDILLSLLVSKVDIKHSYNRLVILQLIIDVCLN